MSPKDLYGKTKLILDEMIFSNEYKNVSAILPGSIVTKKTKFTFKKRIILET